MMAHVPGGAQPGTPIRVQRRRPLPFCQAATVVLLDASLDPVTRALYAILAALASLDARTVQISRRELAETYLGRSTDTLDRHAHKLEELGVLSVERVIGADGTWQASLYVLLDTELGVPDRSGGSRTSATTEQGGSPHQCDKGRRTSATTEHRGVAAPVRPPIGKEVEDKPKTSGAARRERPVHNLALLPGTEPSTPESEAFDAFWAAYPRRDSGKKPARERFIRLTRGKPGLSRAIIEGAQRYADDPNLPPLAFRPLAATWLNREGWTDGPLPSRDEPRGQAAPAPDPRLEEARRAGVVLR